MPDFHLGRGVLLCRSLRCHQDVSVSPHYFGVGCAAVDDVVEFLFCIVLAFGRVGLDVLEVIGDAVEKPVARLAFKQVLTDAALHALAEVVVNIDVYKENDRVVEEREIFPFFLLSVPTPSASIYFICLNKFNKSNKKPPPFNFIKPLEKAT